MLGELTTFEINKLLRNSILGRIGCAVNNQVYVVPIIYAFDGNYIYGHSLEGKKVSVMRENPNVCFEVDQVSNISNWQSVIIHGTYEELLGEKAREAIQFFTNHLRPHFNKKSKHLGYGIIDLHESQKSSLKTVIFRIKILAKSGRFEKN